MEAYMSKSLELYINGEKGGYHTLISVSGVRREKEPFTAQDHQQMLAEALRLLEGGGFEERLRIIDPRNIVVKTRSGQSALTTRQLRMFVTMPGGKLAPEPQERSPKFSDEVARQLGRHLC